MPFSAIASHPAKGPSSHNLVHARSHVIQHSCCETTCKQYAKRSQTTTTATTLSAGRVGWSWGNVLDTTNLHAGTGESTEGRLGTWAWGLGAVTWRQSSSVFVLAVLTAEYRLTTGGSDLDVESSDAQLLAASGDVLSSQHGSVWRGLVTVGLDLHTASNTADGFAATGITQVSL